MVYAYSDGMQDQLGGNENRKFLQRNMLAMFLDVCDKSMEQQNTLIEERIISWRGGNPQVDDMTLVGIRV